MLQANASVIIALLMGLVGVSYVLWQFKRVLSYDQGNQTMRDIAQAIQEGASAFLNREYQVLSIFVAIVLCSCTGRPRCLLLSEQLLLRVPAISACMWRCGPTFGPQRRRALVCMRV